MHTSVYNRLMFNYANYFIEMRVVLYIAKQAWSHAA